MAEENIPQITEEEAALYDRQIRLWGLDAQRRLRAARVLVCGLRGLGAEVSKNIVLSGIKSLTMLDNTLINDEDRCSNFLVGRGDVGYNRAICAVDRTQKLNPMVEVSADDESLKSKDEDYFKQFDVVCVTCQAAAQLTRINDICKRNEIKFYAGDVYGYYGYMFCDLGKHDYAEEKTKVPRKPEAGEPPEKKVKTDEKEVITVKKTMKFADFSKAVSFDWKSEDGAKKVKKTPNLFFLLHVLWKFHEKMGRYPSVESLASDQTELLTLRDEVTEQLGVGCDRVSVDFNKHCFSELSPVCAIVGGVMGQEIIKAVSHKDEPHNNFFLYDGQAGSGMVDQIGCLEE